MRFKLVEKKANGAAVISTLATEFSGFVGIEPEGSKEARMYAASPDYASHCVFVSDPAMPGYEWSLEHIEEVCHFPQEPNDRGDAASQAINFLGTLRPHLQNGDAPRSLFDGQEERRATLSRCY
jgi:predicted phage terminase large subunit-like protein